MKKIIALLMSFLPLGMLASCNKDPDTPTDKKLYLDKATIEIGETHTDFDGMSIQIVSAVWNDDAIKIDIEWLNKTSYDAVYGESFDIEKETDGEWKSCVTLDNLGFNDIGYELNAGAKQKKTYNLTDMFDISQNGKYRFVSYCHIYDKGRGGESVKCELQAEFTVTRIGDIGPDIKKSFVGFEAQYVRTNGYHEDTEYPVVKIIRSVDELNAYYNENKDKYDLERKDTVYSDTTIGFLDACDKYDSEYFEDRILVMVLLEEGSGSNRHNVDNVKIGSDGRLYINISTVVPEVGTSDMAQWHILIEPEVGVDVADESAVTVYKDGVDPETQPSVIRQTGSYSNITLTIPYNWTYETKTGSTDGDYSISFWPEGQTDGKIKMCYYNAFGVCGTGLETEEISLGVYKALKGTYDNSKIWNHIIFFDMPGFYVALNEGAEKWWDEYGDEAMTILSSIKLAEGIITKEQAVEAAKQEATVEYDEIRAEFDADKGIWKIAFYKKNVVGGDQVVSITHEGKIIGSEFGE